MSIYFGVSDESTGFSLQQKLLLKTLLFNAAVTVFLIPPDSKNNSEIQFWSDAGPQGEEKKSF